MDGAEHQVSGLGRDHRELDGGQVADLTDQDDVWILAQRRPQRRRERLAVGADLALVDEAHLAPVEHFDGVLERDDVA